MAKKKEVDLYKKAKKVKGRIKVLKAIPYKGSMVYIRQIDGDIFMYDIIFEKEIYSSYLVITPKKGKTKLSKPEVARAAALILTGAITTIDTLKGDVVSDKETKQAVKQFESARKTFDKGKKKVVN